MIRQLKLSLVHQELFFWMGRGGGAAVSHRQNGFGIKHYGFTFSFFYWGFAQILYDAFLTTDSFGITDSS